MKKVCFIIIIFIISVCTVYYISYKLFIPQLYIKAIHYKCYNEYESENKKYKILCYADKNTQDGTAIMLVQKRIYIFNINKNVYLSNATSLASLAVDNEGKLVNIIYQKNVDQIFIVKYVKKLTLIKMMEIYSKFLKQGYYS